jgi:formylglycine-generating enzyme required for sulfatase activity
MRAILHGGLAVLAAAAVGLAASSPTPADNPPKLETALHKSYAEKIPGSAVKFEMIAVPGGTFQMGSPPGEKGRSDDEGPQHAVALKPFWIGKCEVTWDEYDQYWKSKDTVKPPPPPVPTDADAITRPTPPYADETFGLGREGFPLICVTHHAAMEYCRWLSYKTGKHYRLPTEAEWEYACRAGTTTPFSFGDSPQELDEFAWHLGNSDEVTHQVGQKRPNPWGLFDMHGNVAEWCLDHYQKDFYAKFSADKPTLNPVLLPTADRFSHVVRGGSWADKPERCRSAARRGSDKTWLKLDPQRPQSIWWMTSAEFVGFRIVRAVEEYDNLKNLRSTVTRESK